MLSRLVFCVLSLASTAGAETGAVIAVTGTLDFGPTVTGTVAQSSMTISNAGDLALSISAIDYPDGFTGNWTGSIAAGEATNVAVLFAPTALQAYTGTVTVISDATSGDGTIGISGTGIPVPQFTLTVESEHGGQQPGTIVANAGATVSQWIATSPVLDGTTQYVCTGAAVAGHSFTPASPTNITLTLTNDATLTWLWSTNFLLQVSSLDGGSVSLTGGWYAAGAGVTVTALPAAYMIFSGWTGDVSVGQTTNNPLSWTVAGPRSFAATFAPQLATLTLMRTPTNGGAVVGSGTYQAGSNVAISAIARPGWYFSTWSDGDTNAARTIAMPGSNRTLIATFVRSAPGYWYVTENGTDAASGTNWALAKQTIQAAIDEATAGDVVLVSNGLYAAGGRISVGSVFNRIALTNAITVRSINGPAVTTIRGQGPLGSTAVRCAYVGSGAVLSGFSLDGGYTGTTGSTVTNQAGGGAFCHQLGVVTNCIISNCVASAFGGGTYGGRIYQCQYVQNTSFGQGGGSFTGTLYNCLLRGNVAAQGGGGAAGSPLYSCTVVSNAVTLSGAGGIDQRASAYNSILYFNASGDFGTNCFIMYSCASTLAAGTGNKAGNPAFLDPTAGDFRLGPTSPCINAGNSGYPKTSSDLAGNPRILGTAIDMGAYEALPFVTVTAVPGGSGTIGGGGGYVPGTNVLLSAQPLTGWLFKAWHDGVTNTERTFTMPTNNVSFTAYFTQQIVTVSVATNPPAGGTVTGAGVYQTGSNATLQAMPAANWRFVDWNDGATNPLRVIVAPGSNATYTANFTQLLSTVTLSAAPAGKGTLTGAGMFVVGSSIEIGALPTNYWIFVRWSDGNTNPVRTITVPTNDLALAAFFTQQIVSVTVEASPLEGGMTSGSGSYQAGSAVSIAANRRNAHWFFTAWSDGDTSPARTIQVPVSNVTFTAVFTQSVGSATLFVTTNGNDSADGLSWATALRTIQSALDLSISNDVVLVSNGVHDVGGRVVLGALTNRIAITNAASVIAVNGPSVTFLVGASTPGDAAVRCAYVGPDALLAGFTLTGGATRVTGDPTNDQSGAGALCASSGTISNCVLTGGLANFDGGGVHGGRVHNSILAGNQATYGGGAALSVLNDCLVIDNYADQYAGGALRGTLRNCTVLANSAIFHAAGTYNATAFNCIVYSNIAPVSPNYFLGSFSHCCVTPLPGGPGNITNEPRFVDATAGDFRPVEGSACIDAGSTTNAAASADLSGSARVVNGTVDIGAFEAYPRLFLSSSPAHGGTTSAGGLQRPGTSVEVSSQPAPNWHFTAWSDGATDAVHTFSMPASNLTLTAFFSPLMAGVGVLASPTNGGSVTGAGLYPVGATALVAATAASGWDFLGWDGVETNAILALIVPTGGVERTAYFALQVKVLDVFSAHGFATPGSQALAYGTATTQDLTSATLIAGGTQFVCTGAAVAGQDFTLVSPTRIELVLTNDATLTWLWTTNLLLQASATAGGSLSATGGWVAAGTSVTVTALPDAGMVFSGWTGDVPAALTNSNPLDVPLDRPRAIVATFAPEQKTLLVVSAHGGTDPGTVTAAVGALIAQAITNTPLTAGATQFVCTGAAVSGNAFTPHSGTSISLTLTNDATLVWAWSTNYLLTAQASGSGSVGPSNAWVADGGSITVTATPGPVSVFSRWTGDVPPGQSNQNPLTLTLAAPRSLVAVFTNYPPEYGFVATNSMQATSFPGTNIVQCQIRYPAGRQLLFVLWHPILPSGWTLRSAAGDGSPTVNNGDIVFTAFSLTNPIAFTYTATANYGLTLTNGIRGQVSYLMDGMTNTATVFALPDPLPIPRPVHAADYLDPAWSIDGTEVSWVLAYWRAQRYHIEANDRDHFAPGPGSTNGLRHSADYQSPSWVIGGSEVNRVLAYWRAGGYHLDPVGVDGFAPGQPAFNAARPQRPATMPPSVLLLGAPVTSVQSASALYRPGGTVEVTNVLHYSGSLLSLLLRPHVPDGWNVVSASGPGNPETIAGDIVWTGTIPPSPIEVVYTLEAAPGDHGIRTLRTSIEYQTEGDANPAETFATPDPSTISTVWMEPTTLPDGGIAFGLTGETGISYRVQFSTNLQNWIDGAVVTPTNGVLTLPLDNESPNRLYRIMSSP